MMKKIVVLLVAFAFLLGTVTTSAKPVSSRNSDKGTGRPAWTVKQSTSEPEIIVESEPEIIVEPEPEIISEAELGLLGLEVFASAYGMVPNDSSAANHNAARFNEALNEHGIIIIDDVYHMGTTPTRVTNPSIEVYGTGRAELIFNNSSTTVLFDPAGIRDLVLRDVAFTNLSEGNPVFIVYSSAGSSSKTNSVVIDSCSFQGDISAYRT
ncbi:MAG: hypothetical protein SCL54_15395, partial [Bacillota bacterium]|nr:hypothetical protein [Bacillota bacterium]